jgi:hypothetical protein
MSDANSFPDNLALVIFIVMFEWCLKCSVDCTLGVDVLLICVNLVAPVHVERPLVLLFDGLFPLFLHMFHLSVLQ